MLGYLAGLTDRDDGVIIVATLLLFPTTLALYGGFAVFYSAKEFAEKRAIRKGIAVGIKKGRQAEKERISRAAAARGVVISPEMAEILAEEAAE